MKKLLFCLQTMTCGGVEKELITLLKKFDAKEYNISVLTLYIQDETITSDIPDHVHFINLGIDPDYYYSNTVTMVKKRLASGRIFDALRILFCRIFGISTFSGFEMIEKTPQLDTVFDVAVCYHVHSPLILKYVAENIRANKKIAWVHNEFYATNYPIEKMSRYINKYDEVISVSKRVKAEFDTLMPNYIGQSSYAHNILDAEEIYEKSLECVDEDFLNEKKCKILTVGRFTSQKGFDQAIECCRLLRDNHIDFHWFFIGWGEEEKIYRRMIIENSLGKNITILGRKDNPYPYISNCDIYCQPSRHEAWCLTVTEAKILCKPIVCTDFAGADEQIENGKNGVIVPVGDLKMLYEKVGFLILNPEFRERLSNNLKNTSGSKNDWEKIEKHFR